MRRLLTGGLLLVGVVVLASCHVQIGCRTYRLWEPTVQSGLTMDDSACVTAPPPVVPEAPFAVLLPVAGVGAAGAVVVRRRRRRPEA